ncbi:hypothetical protein L8106_22936 [Lyngbya sp. PCC 8106]|nr:hypothetical protein L8106_22936 [Lyngbya sp. PCC 8106]
MDGFGGLDWISLKIRGKVKANMQEKMAITMKTFFLLDDLFLSDDSFLLNMVLVLVI